MARPCVYLRHMANVALYRKYRPARFEDVRGQEQVTGVLSRALAAGSPSHAYLFAGSRGTGKTSVARIVARAIGTSGRDLYEIDAASNRGIDDVRMLREEVHTLPFESPYKVYIVDECHSLTKEAFNALLKTLEEPPPHVVFILATTEIGKLPETVISRCEVHTFKKPTQQLLSDMALSVAAQEGYALDPAAAGLVALLGDGSYRDMYGALQKLLGAASDRQVSAADAERILSVPSAALVGEVLAALAERDSARGLAAVGSAAESGADIELFLKLLIERVRAVLLLRYARDLTPALREAFSAEDFARIAAYAEDRGACINSAVLTELLAAYEATRHAYLPHLPLELALIKLLEQN